MEQGKRYRIRYHGPIKDRETVADFVEEDQYRYHVSLRPLAGSAIVYKNDLVSAVEVSRDTPVSLPKIVRTKCTCEPRPILGHYEGCPAIRGV